MRGRLLLVGAALAVGGCSRSPEEHLVAARDAVFEHRPQTALREYRLALDAVEKESSPAGTAVRAAALRGAADTYYLELRDVAKALGVYRELVAQAPEAPETVEGHVLLAEILHHHYHDLRGAIAELTAALARKPARAADLSYEVCKLYFELGDYQQCTIESEKLMQSFPDSPRVPDALFLAGQAYAMQEATRAQAEHAFQSLAERYPSSELAPHALFELGKLRAEDGDSSGAIKAWVAALPRHPDPKVVQAAIARTRARIAQTTPAGLGQAAAFAKGELAPHHARTNQAKTSVEAAGGTAAEAAKEHGD
ncbi:MAG: tetratricopeptide repeat protein [Myxococcaceae bacterium]